MTASTAPVRLLTPEQVASIVGLSTSTLAKMRCQRSDGIEFRKLGAAVRYAEADVLAWIAARPVRRSTSDSGNTGAAA